MSSPSEKDSQEYISFSDSPHPCGDRKSNLSNSFDRNQHRMNQSQNQYGRRGFRHDGGDHYHRRQFSHSTPYSREKNSFQRNFRNSTPHQNPNYQKKKDHEFDVSKYFHPSMLDNPWAELEERLQTKVGNDSESSMDDSDNESLNGSEGSAKNESVNSICPDSF